MTEQHAYDFHTGMLALNLGIAGALAAERVAGQKDILEALAADDQDD